MPSDWETSLEGSVTSVAACPVSGGMVSRQIPHRQREGFLPSSPGCLLQVPHGQPIPYEPLPTNTEPEMEVSWLPSSVKPSLWRELCVLWFASHGMSELLQWGAECIARGWGMLQWDAAREEGSGSAMEHSIEGVPRAQQLSLCMMWILVAPSGVILGSQGAWLRLGSKFVIEVNDKSKRNYGEEGTWLCYS